MQLSDMRRHTGMIIPVWCPSDAPSDRIKSMIWECIRDSGPFVQPQAVVVVADGSPSAERAIMELRTERGEFEMLSLADNQGKGGAVAAGITRLLEMPEIHFFVTRDQDNDQLCADTSNLVRLAAHICKTAGTDLVVVAGRRSSVHRHLGFTRGELEWLMNDIVFNAVRWTLARNGKVPDTRFFAAYEHIPDMQTGFKCYTRTSAALLLKAMTESNTVAPGLDVRRHGAEIPAIVETLLAGGVVGEINRLAWENQPMTTYDVEGRIQVKGTVLAWTLERAAVPMDIARQLFLNAMARRLLAKEKHGLELMVELANWTLEYLAFRRGTTHLPICEIGYSDYF